MLPVLEQLLVIQDRDKRIAQLKAEQVRVPELMAAVDAGLTQEAARLESLRQEFKHVESERKRLEIDAETERGQINKYKTQLFQIKSNVEYQALLKEIAGREQQVRGIEDHELESMEKAEECQRALKEEQSVVSELTGKAETEKADLIRRAEVIAQELSQLQAEREQLAAATDPDLLGRYERLMRSKGDAAIVPIRDNGNCGGCHLQVPPQVVHDSKNSGELTSCDYCGRILYWQSE